MLRQTITHVKNKLVPSGVWVQVPPALQMINVYLTSLNLWKF